MVILELVGIAFLTAVTALLLKSTRPELSFAVTAAGCIILLLLILDLVKDSFSVLGDIAGQTGIDARDCLQISDKIRLRTSSSLRGRSSFSSSPCPFWRAS